MKKIRLEIELHDIGNAFIKATQRAVIASGITDMDLVIGLINQEIENIKTSFDKAVEEIKSNDKSIRP